MSNVIRDTWTDHRLTPPVEFERLLSEALPPVYIAPRESRELCEIGSGEEFTRVSRAELEEWARAILHALGTS